MYCPTIRGKCKQSKCRDWSAEYQKCWQLIRLELGYKECIISIQDRKAHLEDVREHIEFLKRINKQSREEEEG